ncbi:MAG: hypothetical protein AAFO82_14150, partial [Bacteroidota bacterium]
MRIQIWNVLLVVLIWNNCTAPQEEKAIEKTPTTKLVATKEDTSTSVDSLSSILNLAYVMGKFDPAQHEDFTKIELKHADRGGLYLRKDTYAAFI